MGSRLERTERLLNLVFCLMAAPRPVPRSTIRASVAGYDPDASTEAFERMFERDKEELRGMGIPIDTVLDANGDVAGYRIQPSSYRLVDVHLSREEQAAVGLAARVWDGVALSETAALAALKLAAADDDRGTPTVELPQFARLTAEDAHLLPTLRSAREGRPLAFDYRGLHDSEPSRRMVDAWAVIARSGHWYLIGFDHDREAPRAFRLSRIHGQVAVAPGQVSHPRPEGFDPEDFIRFEPGEVIEATITVSAGGGAELMRRAVAARSVDRGTVLDVRMDRNTLIGLLTSSIRFIVDVEPTYLLDDVRERLTRVLQTHAVEAPRD